MQHFRRRRGRDAEGQKQHLLSRGTTVPLSRPQSPFPSGWGQQSRHFHSKSSDQCVHPEVPSGVSTPPLWQPPAPPPPPFSVVVSTLQTPLSWDGLCVQHFRRRRGRDAEGQKQRSWVAGAHQPKTRLPVGCGQRCRQHTHGKRSTPRAEVCVDTGSGGGGGGAQGCAGGGGRLKGDFKSGCSVALDLSKVPTGLPPPRPSRFFFGGQP